MVWKLRVLSATSRLGEGLWILSEPGFRPGESGSPKRDVLVRFWCFVCILAQERWEGVLGERVARPGERFSPKRDDVFWLLS